MSLTSLEARAISIAPLPELFLRRVRSHGIDDLGQPVRRIVAEGGEPCRDVLRRARPGEALILASFTPFTKSGPYREYGPIFVLANESEEEIQRGALPPAGADANYLRQHFVIRAYNEAEEICDAALVPAPDFEPMVERFFSSAGTAFLHVRFPTYGCFACRIDRA